MAAATGGRPMPGGHVSFEDLLEREWSANQHSGGHSTNNGTRQVAKKPFLKRGARGWWKDSDKAKPMAYTLSSTHDDEQGVSTSRRPPTQTQQRPALPRSRRTQPPIASSNSGSRQNIPSTVLPEPRRHDFEKIQPRRDPSPPRRVLGASSARYVAVAHPSPSLLPIASSNNADVREQLSSNWSIDDDYDDDPVVHASHQQPSQLHSHSHQPTFVTQSYDWKLEQDAHDLEEFESLEQQLLQQHEQLPPSKSQSDDMEPVESSPWTLHEENERRDLLAELDAWSREDIVSNRPPAPPSLYDPAQPLHDQHNDLYDQRDSFLDDDEGELGHLSSMLPIGQPGQPQYDTLMEGSLDLSFADSEPWDEQRPQPTSNSVQVAQQHEGLSQPPASGATEDVEVATPEPKYMVGQVSYVQQRFQQAAAANKAPPPSSSLQTLKMKLKMKAAASTGARAAEPSAKASGKTAGKHPPPQSSARAKREKPHPSTSAPSPPKPQSSGASSQPPPSKSSHFPAGIDDKLHELEQEVKHYKQETLKLQKRREALEADQRKLDQQRQDWHEEKRQVQDEMDAEWKKIRKERRALDQTLKFGPTGALPDRKERAEIDALRAQIVKMQMDDKAKTSKHKAATDFFRHRIAELEMRNQELRDDLKFMEEERLANWNWANDARPDHTPHAPPDAPIVASTPSLSQKSVATAKQPGVNGGHTIKTDDDLYNPSHYQKKDSMEPHESLVSPRGRRPSVDEDDHSFDHDVHEDEQRGELLLGVAAPTEAERSPRQSPPSGEGRTTDKWEEIHHAGGKVERRYTSGPIAKAFRFANGTEKDVYVDGHTIVRFSNGDIKETYPSEGGKTVYYYAAAETRHTTYADQTQVFEFPNGQVEKHYANGAKEITFIDGTTKRIETNGDELSTFPDGTRMVEKKSGFREVINPDGSKARDYPDGRTTWVTPQGVEQPVQYKRPSV